MKQQEVFKKIGGIIKELNDQYEYLNGVDGRLNELELELFIANSHFLTDHVVILSKLNAQLTPAPAPVEKGQAVEEPEPEIQEEAPKESYFEPLVQAAVPADKNNADDKPVPEIDIHTGVPEDSYSVMQTEPETIRHELILDEADWDDEDEPYENEEFESPADEEEIVIPPIPVKPVATAKIEKEKPATDIHAAHTIRKPGKEDVLTVNEKISAQMGEKKSIVSEHVNAQSISDLKSAINLNDKLLYIKELFNGYNLAYSEAIDILNRFNSFDEADLFLKKNYVVKNTWDSKPETSGKFYALLKRRYE